MAIARARLVDLSVARWYHCITRYVRRARLLGSATGRPIGGRGSKTGSKSWGGSSRSPSAALRSSTIYLFDEPLRLPDLGMKQGRE